jgi:hypothetical protein
MRLFRHYKTVTKGFLTNLGGSGSISNKGSGCGVAERAVEKSTAVRCHPCVVPDPPAISEFRYFPPAIRLHPISPICPILPIIPTSFCYPNYPPIKSVRLTGWLGLPTPAGCGSGPPYCCNRRPDRKGEGLPKLLALRTSRRNQSLRVEGLQIAREEKAVLAD